MIIFGCLLIAAIVFAPRLVLILAWIFGDRWDIVWQGNWIVPALGIILLPFTTIMYLLVWDPGVGLFGIGGFDWVWLAMGVVLDIIKWGQLAATRGKLPTPQVSTEVDTSLSSIPNRTVADPSEPVTETEPAAVEETEEAGLASLRDSGVLTEDEYQAKMEQLKEE